MQKISKTQKRIKLEWKRELKNFFNTCLRIIMMDAGLPKVWSVIVNKRKDLDYNLQVFKNLLFKELWFKTNRRSPPEPVNKTKEWICLVKKKEQKARNTFLWRCEYQSCSSRHNKDFIIWMQFEIHLATFSFVLIQCSELQKKKKKF